MKEFDDYKTFEAKVSINRLEDKGVFMADIAIRCLETGEVMEFEAPNLQCGFSLNRPMLNPGGTELRIPIRPPIQDKPANWSNEQEWSLLCADPNQEKKP